MYGQIMDECYLSITKTFFVNIDFKLAHDKRPSETVSDGLGYWKRLFQCFQQFPVYSAEAAVAHDQNMVTCFGIFHDFGNKGIEVLSDV